MGIPRFALLLLEVGCALGDVGGANELVERESCCFKMSWSTPFVAKAFFVHQN